MNSSRFPRGSQRNGPPRRLVPQLQRLDAYRETNCGGMRSNRSRKHESTKTRQWPRWRRSLVRGGFLSSSIETPSSEPRSIDVNRYSKNKLRFYVDRRFLGLRPSQGKSTPGSACPSSQAHAVEAAKSARIEHQPHVRPPAESSLPSRHCSRLKLRGCQRLSGGSASARNPRIRLRADTPAWRSPDAWRCDRNDPRPVE